MAHTNTLQDLQNLKCLVKLHYRILKCQIENNRKCVKPAFSITRKELVALGINTAKELRRYDEGEWIKHITYAEWDKQKFGKKGIFYREDLKGTKKMGGELEHIPGEAEIERIWFNTSGPLPLFPIREKIQEMRIAIEASDISDYLVMCKWPGNELINTEARTVAELTIAQQRHFTSFRMLNRILRDEKPDPANEFEDVKNISLRDPELTILYQLAKGANTNFTVRELAENLGDKESTTGSRFQKLLKKGLAEHAEEGLGYHITDKGKLFIKWYKAQNTAT